MIYSAINQPVFQQIPQQAQRILDIGCGSGALGKTIKQRQNCDIVGITYSKAEADLASQFLDRLTLK
jgi:cyclopropane fatty-acyl-phospholipid synthase-like methyltransferase